MKARGAKRKAKFNVGQVVCDSSEKISEDQYFRIGFKEFLNGEWVYRRSRWASWGYSEKDLRPLTAKERGK